MKQIFEITLILILTLTVVTHFLKIIFLYIKPPNFLDISTLTNLQPTKINLVVYYILTISVCIFFILKRI